MPASDAGQDTGTEAPTPIDDLSGAHSRIEDATANLSVLLSAIGYIASDTLEFMRRSKAPLDAKCTVTALNIVVGLGAIAEEELKRGCAGLTEADGIVYSLTKAAA